MLQREKELSKHQLRQGEDEMCSKTDLHSFEGPGGRAEKGVGQGEGS